MSKVEQKILQRLNSEAPVDFQGLQIQAYYRGQKKVDVKWGKTYSYYDLASLTKILFTTLWCLKRLQEEPGFLKQKVSVILPWYAHKSVEVGTLLNHSAGNLWWKPFYKKVPSGLEPEQAYQVMEHFCREAPLSKTARAVYSDIDFYLLGSVMQKVEGKPLIDIWKNLKSEFYSKSSLHFHYKNKTENKVSSYAPTEQCPWRQKVVRGQVHDENAWALGGIAPHAGLFGTVSDLSSYGLLLRSIWQDQNTKISRATLKKMVTRTMSEAKGDWGYGFMLPSGQGSSAGTHFDKTSFGHTGFTGTSFWLDPTRDLFVALVSNRVHPTRKNKDFQRIRPMLHDWIVEELT